MSGRAEARRIGIARSRVKVCARAVVLDSAGPSYEGRELVERIQQQLIRLDCMTGEPSLRFRCCHPAMAALRALKKITAGDGCGRQKLVAAPRCLHVNNEDFVPRLVLTGAQG